MVYSKPVRNVLRSSFTLQIDLLYHICYLFTVIVLFEDNHPTGSGVVVSGQCVEIYTASH